MVFCMATIPMVRVWLMPFDALDWNLEHTDILIIGAGGATRGVIYPLVQAGAKKIVIANRTLARAEQLVADFKLPYRKPNYKPSALDAL